MAAQDHSLARPRRLLHLVLVLEASALVNLLPMAHLSVLLVPEHGDPVSTQVGLPRIPRNSSSPSKLDQRR